MNEYEFEKFCNEIIIDELTRLTCFNLIRLEAMERKHKYYIYCSYKPQVYKAARELLEILKDNPQYNKQIKGYLF